MDNSSVKNDALKFLTEKDRLTAVIGTCPTDGNAHVATIYYHMDENFNFYFLTATNTQKYKNLMENPNAAIAIGFGPSYTTIQGQGTAVLLEKSSKEENDAIARIKKRLQDHDNELWPVFQLDAYAGQQIAVFKFIPQRLHLLNLEQNSGLAVTGDDVLQII